MNERAHCCDCERYYALIRSATDVGTMKAADPLMLTDEQKRLTEVACKFLTREIETAMLPKVTM